MRARTTPQPAAQDPDAEGPPPRRRRRRLTWALALAAAVALVVVAVFSFTPWPAAMIVRAVFEKNGAETVAEMQRHVPDTPVRAELGVPYGSGGDDTTLDLFTTAAAGESRPVVVWIHGGAWVSGSSANVDPYLRILADSGYTAIGLNYSLGPEQVYPTAVRQLNDALGYIDANADDLAADADRIVLAGDSAGAQLASQLAALTTNADYAELLDITPALRASQLAGVVLNCGIYDVRSMDDLNGLIGWGFGSSLWAYTGTKDWSVESAGATMSTIDFVASGFPPTFISGGNGDGLTWLQGIPMAQRLRQLDVDVTTLFWPADHKPALPHEYQFHLDRPEAQQALAETLTFLAKVAPLPAE
ncbi:alpha/beta hydrolase [Microbacterium sp. VKM Ac-2923]|uniref:alpha/beta hydrolase n=1 Tax=Microbacterium sp. VKM Ac-2923 TaxID=2929476 RepID=UPI001FB49E44|nr:alpha/beta hydrolase [Microbacterium sp. VKM Ac-2923]MCJ1708350.1 alpha/beta hydrolase [Microbacterium sp. VKM Ac-2923]